MATDRRKRWRAGVLLAVAAIAGFVLLCLSTAGPFRSVSGQRIAAREANRRLWHCHVPEEASDVSFVSAYRGTRVECTLSQEHFEEWCHRRGWRPIPIESGGTTHFHSQRDGPVKIDHGLQFSDMHGDFGCSGLYDADRKRAYVTYSGG